MCLLIISAHIYIVKHVIRKRKIRVWVCSLLIYSYSIISYPLLSFELAFQISC